MCNLHLKSKTLSDISFVTFWRLKLFWVEYPKLADRNTCLCKTCENTKFLAEALFELKIFKTAKLQVVENQIVWCSKEKKCMYRELQKLCRQTHWRCCCRFQSGSGVGTTCTVQEIRTFKNGEQKKVTLTQKATEHGTAENLGDIFHIMLSKVLSTCFQHYEQFQHYSFWDKAWIQQNVWCTLTLQKTMFENSTKKYNRKTLVLLYRREEQSCSFLWSIRFLTTRSCCSVGIPPTSVARNKIWTSPCQLRPFL